MGSLAAGERIGDDDFVIGADWMRGEIARTNRALLVNAEDVASNPAILVEQVQRKRWVCAGEVDQQFLKRCAVRFQLASATRNAAKNRRNMHPHGHVTYASTLRMRGRPLVISRQDSPRSLVAYSEPELVPK